MNIDQWCYPTISASASLFFCLQSFPASRSFPVSQLFTSGGQSMGVISPSNEYSGLISFRIDWFYLLVIPGTLKSLRCCSVTKSYLTLCDPMSCSLPGFPVLHYLLELAQTHVCWVGRCHPTISFSVIPFSSCPQSFSASGAFPMSQFFTSGSQNIGVSASVSVLPMSIQDWSHLGWTGWISLQSKGLTKVFSNITIWKHQFFGTQLSL